MRRRLHSKLVVAFAAVALFALFFSLRLTRQDELQSLRSWQDIKPVDQHIGDDDDTRGRRSTHIRRVSSVVAVYNEPSLDTVSVLLGDWEVLLISDDGDRCLVEDCFCRFQNNATSPARFAGRLPTSERIAFKCTMPNSVRRLRPFLMPSLTGVDDVAAETQMPELYRWSFLVYDSLTTENDVVLFVKGVNHRQGMSRSPSEFNCIFHGGESDVVVKTAVTSSYQEVFRCVKPDLTAFGSSVTVRVSIQIKSENDLVVPSVAIYAPRRSVANPEAKKLLCASAMVYNAAKFLREWVTYHASVGVDKFILYDNDSNDNLSEVVSELNNEGYDLTTTFWVWPKTQEAGFSHIAVHGKESCAWMMYVDIDEFVFSPSWITSSQPSTNMLKSLLPGSSSSSSSDRPIGQVSIRCNEFGPSSQRSHPAEGVTQGYTCRRSVEQRHKSIVLLEAVDESLMNVVHHFGLKKKYVTKTVNMERGVVNHYKYQAWPEFRNKFRRRVSTYVVDWTQKSNLGSKDRTPGLGFEPIEPLGWDHKFCDVRDHRLKTMTRRWFSSDDFKLSWQR